MWCSNDVDPGRVAGAWRPATVDAAEEDGRTPLSAASRTDLFRRTHLGVRPENVSLGGVPCKLALLENQMSQDADSHLSFFVLLCTYAQINDIFVLAVWLQGV